MHIAIKFLLAVLPLIVVLIGIVKFKVSGAWMSVIGLVLALALAVGAFKTGGEVALRSALYGLIKSLGISVAIDDYMLEPLD